MEEEDVEVEEDGFSDVKEPRLKSVMTSKSPRSN